MATVPAHTLLLVVHWIAQSGNFRTCNIAQCMADTGASPPNNLLIGDVAAQAGALGAVAAPWFVYLGQQTGASFVPFVVFGSLSILAGLATPAMPETLGIPAAASMQVQLHACTPKDALLRVRGPQDSCSLSYHVWMSRLAVCCIPSICMLMACRAGLKASQSGLTGYSLLMRSQELTSPVRQYKMLSLRHMFRTRGSATGNLQKAFFRTSDADADVA